MTEEWTPERRRRNNRIIAVYVAGAAICVLVLLCVAYLMICPTQEPAVFAQFDAWVKSRFNFNDAILFMYAVVTWILLSIRDTLRNVEAELKSIKEELAKR